MRIAIHSDLHLEGYPIPDAFLEDTSYDVLVLAGDIVSARTMSRLKLIRNLVPRDKRVVYVPGNHEWYGSHSYESQLGDLQEFCGSLGFDLLIRNAVKIGDVVFVGCVSWSTLDSYQEFPFEQKRDEVAFGISDFRAIGGFSVDKMISIGEQDKRFLFNACSAVREFAGDDTKIVYVTHFAPTEAHGNPKFAPSRISSYFSNSLDEVCYNDVAPDLWIYGHTHFNYDVYQSVYHTQFVANQRGYGNECHNYNPNFILEI